MDAAPLNRARMTRRPIWFEVAWARNGCLSCRRHVKTDNRSKLYLRKPTHDDKQLQLRNDNDNAAHPSAHLPAHTHTHTHLRKHARAHTHKGAMLHFVNRQAVPENAERMSVRALVRQRAYDEQHRRPGCCQRQTINTTHTYIITNQQHTSIVNDDNVRVQVCNQRVSCGKAGQLHGLHQNTRRNRSDTNWRRRFSRVLRGRQRKNHRFCADRKAERKQRDHQQQHCPQ